MKKAFESIFEPTAQIHQLRNHRVVVNALRLPEGDASPATIRLPFSDLEPIVGAVDGLAIVVVP